LEIEGEEKFKSVTEFTDTTLLVGAVKVRLCGLTPRLTFALA
jgi:hypothetical protein